MEKGRSRRAGAWTTCLSWRGCQGIRAAPRPAGASLRGRRSRRLEAFPGSGKPEGGGRRAGPDGPGRRQAGGMLPGGRGDGGGTARGGHRRMKSERLFLTTAAFGMLMFGPIIATSIPSDAGSRRSDRLPGPHPAGGSRSFCRISTLRPSAAGPVRSSKILLTRAEPAVILFSEDSQLEPPWPM